MSAGHVQDCPSSFVAPRTADNFANAGDEISDAARMRAQDMAANPALITSAFQPGNIDDTVTVGGTTIRTYRRVLPDRTQVWAEVHNGAETTNGWERRCELGAAVCEDTEMRVCGLGGGARLQ